MSIKEQLTGSDYLFFNKTSMKPLKTKQTDRKTACLVYSAHRALYENTFLVYNREATCANK